jgi:hypothetical protein|nr:MAG TPA: hypothetical protein [Caudoviricetes sp.]
MTKKFAERVLSEGVVDTAKYRYKYRAYYGSDCRDHVKILRLPLADLDTTEAINGWKTVMVVY